MIEIDKIYLGDAFDYLKQIDNESIDLVLTDPPYGISSEMKITRTRNTMKFKATTDLIGNFGEWDKFKNIQEFFSFTYSWVNEIDRVLRKGGMFISYFDRDKINFLSHYLQNKEYNTY